MAAGIADGYDRWHEMFRLPRNQMAGCGSYTSIEAFLWTLLNASNMSSMSLFSPISAL